MNKNRLWVVMTNKEGYQTFVPLAQLARKEKGNQTIKEFCEQAQREYDIVKIQIKSA